MIWHATPPVIGEAVTDPLHSLYTTLLTHHDSILQAMYKFDHYLEYMFSHSSLDGDGDGLEDLRGVLFLQERFPGLFVDYSDTESMALEDGTIPSAAAGVVCFPLHPKPHHIRDKMWVRRHWDTSSLLSSAGSALGACGVNDECDESRPFTEEID
jgi:hypothetical protein